MVRAQADDHLAPDEDVNLLGGYEGAYRACPCVWGTEPGSVLLSLHARRPIRALRALDLGCGEGKNAAWLAALGCSVDAIDLSATAIAHAKELYPSASVRWRVGDVRDLSWVVPQSYDLVVAYGLLHCMPDEPTAHNLLAAIRAATSTGGAAVVVAFNDGPHDLSAHPGFRPLLLPHATYIDAFSGWDIELATDTLLHETHPHNGIPHYHSMTRIAARKPEC